MKTEEMFIEAIKKGKNCLLTGGGGVGKTYTINQMIKNIHTKRIILTATTGLASLHVGGSTIHSFSNMGIHSHVSEIDQVKKGSKWWKATERIKRFDLVIIDEISMLASDQVDLLDLIFKEATGNHSLPFGGKQMIFVGDFLQLPPVVKDKSRKATMDYIYWAFTSRAWKEARIETFHLTEVKRQNEQDTIMALNEIRFGRVGPLTNALFSSREGATLDTENEPVRLMPTNKEVDKINHQRLADLSGEIVELKGAFSYNEKIESDKERAKIYYNIINNCTAPELIGIKEKSRVILLKNNSEDGYVNGSMGTFIEHGWYIDTNMPKYLEAVYWLEKEGIPYEDMFKKHQTLVGHIRLPDESIKKINANSRFEHWSPKEGLVVELDSGRTVLVSRAKFPYRSGDYIDDITGEVEDDAVYHQFPVRLAWAITIHKSQGMTLDNVEIHMNRIFSEGQAYVALSRARSIWGIKLIGWNPRKIIADPNAVDFYYDLNRIENPEDEIRKIREGING